MNRTLKDLGRNIISREEKNKSRPKVSFRDNRSLSEMLSNLANEELKQKQTTKFTIENSDIEDIIPKYRPVTTQINDKRENKSKPSIEKMDIIKEANKIMQNRNKDHKNTLSSRGKFRANVISDTREICMKNYMIDLLKYERTMLNDKELLIRKALGENEAKFDSDYTKFLKYIEDEKRVKKNSEEKYLKLINENKNAIEREKQLSIENKMILDEFEKTIKMIMNLKNYTFFVHFVLGVDIKTIDGKIINENNLNESLLRNKDIEHMCKIIVDELGRMESYIEFGDTNFFDTSRLTSKFSEMEENVLKILEKKHQINRELKANEDASKHDLKELDSREVLVLEEYNKIQSEINKEKIFMEDLRNQTKDNISDKDVKLMIHELYLEAENSNHLTTFKKRYDENEIRDLIEMLRIKENKIINCITQLDEIEKKKDPTLLKLIADRKEKNKETKQNFQKNTEKEFEKLKVMKASERSNRIVIRGRPIMTHSNINKKEKKREDNVKLYNDDDDKYMLYYEDV